MDDGHTISQKHMDYPSNNDGSRTLTVAPGAELTGSQSMQPACRVASAFRPCARVEVARLRGLYARPHVTGDFDLVRAANWPSARALLGDDDAQRLTLIVPIIPTPRLADRRLPCLGSEGSIVHNRNAYTGSRCRPS